MPCYHPLQAISSRRSDGKMDIKFSSSACINFVAGIPSIGNQMSLPCGRCIGCRLERSRQWAVRIMHEASLYDSNVFVTLTYDDNHLPSDLSLDKSHFQLFMKRLRQEFDGVRYYHCGEYGETTFRPHYHACLFNIDFKDKVFYKRNGPGQMLYTSDKLTQIWGKGHVIIGDLSFDSAAYVARYCLKKVTGEQADEHYKGRQPEYATMSRRPGIGKAWFDKYKSDVYPNDFVLSKGVVSKPPRFYDSQLEKLDAECYDKLKNERLVKTLKRAQDQTCERLGVREKVKLAQIKSLNRSL